MEYDSNGDLEAVNSKSSERRNLVAAEDGEGGDESEVTRDMAAER